MKKYHHCVKFTYPLSFQTRIPKVDQHTGGKWLIHGTKHRKDNQLHVIYACFISLYTYDVYFTCDMYFVFYYALARESTTFVVLRHSCTFCTVYTCTIGRILALG